METLGIKWKADTYILNFQDDLEPSMIEKVQVLTNTLRLGLDNIRKTIRIIYRKGGVIHV